MLRVLRLRKAAEGPLVAGAERVMVLRGYGAERVLWVMVLWVMVLRGSSGCWCSGVMVLKG